MKFAFWCALITSILFIFTRRSGCDPEVWRWKVGGPPRPWDESIIYGFISFPVILFLFLLLSRWVKQENNSYRVCPNCEVGFQPNVAHCEKCDVATISMKEYGEKTSPREAIDRVKKSKLKTPDESVEMIRNDRSGTSIFTLDRETQKGLEEGPKRIV